VARPILCAITGVGAEGAGTKIQTTDGSGVNGHVGMFNSSGTLVDSGVAALAGPAATLTLAPSGPGNFTVAHGLGTTPSAMSILMTSDGGIYAQTTPYDSVNVYLTASDIGVTGKCYVFTASIGGSGPAGAGAGPATTLSLTPSTAGNFTVAHGLGVVPTGAYVSMTSGGAIWLQTPTHWDSTNIYLTASDPSITGIVAVFTASIGGSGPAGPTGPSGSGNLQTKTSSYGTVSTDGTILMNSASATTLTLNTSGLVSGQMIRIKNINTGIVTVTPSSGTIDGSASITIAVQYETIEVVFDLTNFWVV